MGPGESPWPFSRWEICGCSPLIPGQGEARGLCPWGGELVRFRWGCWALVRSRGRPGLLLGVCAVTSEPFQASGWWADAVPGLQVTGRDGWSWVQTLQCWPLLAHRALSSGCPRSRGFCCWVYHCGSYRSSNTVGEPLTKSPAGRGPAQLLARLPAWPGRAVPSLCPVRGGSGPLPGLVCSQERPAVTSHCG